MTGNAILPTGLTRPFGTPAKVRAHTQTLQRRHTHTTYGILTHKRRTWGENGRIRDFLCYLWRIIGEQEACQSMLLSHDLWQLLRIHKCSRRRCTGGRVIWGRLLICAVWGRRSAALIYCHGLLSCLAEGEHTSKHITCNGKTKNNEMTNSNTSPSHYVT